MRPIIKCEIENFFFCRNTPGIKWKNSFDPPGSFDKIFHTRGKVQETRNKIQTTRLVPCPLCLVPCAFSLVPSPFLLSLPSYEKSSRPVCSESNRRFAFGRDQN